MDPLDPPETQSEPPPETEPVFPHFQIEDLDLSPDVLAEIDAMLLATPQAEPKDAPDAPPGARVRLLTETNWSLSITPWHEMMALTPVREPVHMRTIFIKEALNLRDFLNSRIRKRNAMLAQAIGVRVTPECEHCAQGKGQFVGCVVVPDMLEGSCANCVWERSRGQRPQCSFRE